MPKSSRSHGGQSRPVLQSAVAPSVEGWMLWLQEHSELLLSVLMFGLFIVLWLNVICYAADSQDTEAFTPLYQIESGQLTPTGPSSEWLRDNTPMTPLASLESTDTKKPSKATQTKKASKSAQPAPHLEPVVLSRAEHPPSTHTAATTPTQPSKPTLHLSPEKPNAPEVLGPTPNVTEYINQLSRDMEQMANRPPEIKLEESYAIFPVLSHSNFNKAFSDLPVMLSSQFSTELSKRLYAQHKQARVMNPIHSYDVLRQRGLERVYQRLVQDYMQAGVPLDSDLYALTDALNTNVRKVAWVAFIESHLDMTDVTRPPGYERPIKFLYEQLPKSSWYYIQSDIKVFKLTDEGAFLAWEGSSKTRVRGQNIGSITNSVYDTGNSIHTFKRATMGLASRLLDAMPPDLNPTKEIKARVIGTQAGVQPETTPTPTASTGPVATGEGASVGDPSAK